LRPGLFFAAPLNAVRCGRASAQSSAFPRRAAGWRVCWPWALTGWSCRNRPVNSKRPEKLKP